MCCRPIATWTVTNSAYGEKRCRDDAVWGYWAWRQEELSFWGGEEGVDEWIAFIECLWLHDLIGPVAPLTIIKRREERIQRSINEAIAALVNSAVYAAMDDGFDDVADDAPEGGAMDIDSVSMGFTSLDLDSLDSDGLGHTV